MNRASPLALVASLLMAVAACGGDSQDVAASESPAPSPAPAPGPSPAPSPTPSPSPQPAPPPPPTSIAAMGAGQWMELPNTKIRSVVPSGQGGNPVNIVEAWSGATVDSRRSRLVVWGGGHSDYWGNEVYALELSTLSIKRIVDPSGSTSQSNCNSSLPDGTPVSRHTYGGLAYIESSDKMFAVGGSMAPCGNVDMASWTYDFAGQRWQKVVSTSPTVTSFGFMAAYDAQTQRVLVKDREDFYAYSPSSNSYTKLNASTQDVSLYYSAALDTKRRKFVMVGDGNVQVIDLATNQMSTLATTNAPAGLSADSPGLGYDPVADRIVLWSGGSNVWALNMDTRAWTQVATNAGPGVPQAEKGTFGRWGYIPQYNVFALINSIDQNAWVFRVSR